MNARWALAGWFVALLGATGLSQTGTQAPVAPRPATGVPGAAAAPGWLSETGLYAGEGTRVVDSRNRPFAPQYPLWSDGAGKRRWVQLPPGSAIDVSDIDRWVFPVGTKFWKEFDFDGRKVETRFLWKVSEGEWVFASYAWNEAQTDASLVPESGLADAADIAPGKRHSIPSLTECRSCHDSARTEILGFNALQLSDDRDPNALHADPLAAGMLTLRSLAAERLMSPQRTELVASSPRIDASSPLARAALGYLSTNCGSCHNRESSIASLGLILKHEIRDQGAGIGEQGARRGACTPALATTVGRKGHWVVPAHPEQSRVINPGRPELSSLIQRVRSRRPSSQMPPVGTVVQDRAAIDLLTAWVKDNPAGWAQLAATCGAGGS